MRRLFATILHRLLQTRPGCLFVHSLIRLTQYRVFSPRTVHAMEFDLLRLRARTRRPSRGVVPAHGRLHVGCGTRRVPGWLNVDVAGSEYDVDLACGALPWADGSFAAIVSQHVIEHLELHSELLPLVRELRRVAKPGADVWLSCPDLEAMCRAYGEDKAAAIYAHRQSTTTSDMGMTGVPTQHYINLVFDQWGEHRNLLDFELLERLLTAAGFIDCRRVVERDLLARFPEFLPRGDDIHTIYVRAIAP